MRPQDLANWANSWQSGAPRVAVFEVDDERADSMETPLSSAGVAIDRALAQRGRRDRAHRRPAAVRAALRRVLGALLQLPADEVQLFRGKDGRPKVAGAMSSTSLEISIAACGAMGVFAVAVDCQVGVDLEVVDSNRFPNSIASAVLHPQELWVFDALPSADRTAWLAGLWVCKEAFLKGIGLGLGIDPRIIEVSCLDRSAPAGEVPFRVTGWAPWCGWLSEREGVLTALACANPAARTQIIRLTPQVSSADGSPAF